MITEDYISFETAKLLKEKGFDWEESPFYSEQDKDEWKQNNSYSVPNEDYNPDIPFDTETLTKVAPHISLQMAMKWLREVHKINIEVCLGFDADSELGFFYNPVISDLKNMALAIETPEFDETEFTVYEEAAEAGIKYCLENLI